jgi:hypothetical protein
MDLSRFKVSPEQIRLSFIKKNNGVVPQSTYHQNFAVETAELFKDNKYLGRYLYVAKKYKHTIGRLEACRDWVNSRENVTHKGKLFFSSLPKFLK